MITFYEVVKFVHILAAIIAVGFNISYGVLIARAAREPEHQLHVLRTIKVLDDRFANPAYGVLVGTGLLNVLTSPWKITEFWILSSLVLVVLLALGGAIAYTPTLRREISILEAEGPSSVEFEKLARRGKRIGMVLSTGVIAIIFLMVTKPTV